MPVSLGVPQHIAGLKDIVRNPIYAAGVGLLQYGLEREKEMPARHGQGSGALTRLKSWFSENF